MEANASSASFLDDEAEANITLRNQLESPLLRLPAELRNKIYVYVGAATVIQVVTRSPTPANAEEYTKLLKYPQPDLLNTCNQVRQEGSYLLYKYALFDLSNCSFLAVLFHRCVDNCCERMTSVKVDWRPVQYAARNFLDEDGGWSDEHDGIISVLRNVETIHIEADPIRLWFKDSSIRAVLKGWCENHTAEIVFEDIHKSVLWDGYWDHHQNLIA
ncbi:uncharacterized protein J4E84_007334 [Alternaria hordeiaustralica]|uniref:uncharacterized protein n=1 Tax=Alternaria hordeiaustralica TaxID=1187925 RepID=UPI0020C4B7AA|nr:uncharacterized protein J4E84_007334 [Alternaria hordeiaustralica]KAI4681739.1 hypothetical protein J4E84_007334 [Alternaria hordeiaustralica]